MLTRLITKLTQPHQNTVSDNLVPDPTFWRALDLVADQFLDDETRHHDGPDTDLYEHEVCKALRTVDYWLRSARLREWFRGNMYE